MIEIDEIRKERNLLRHEVNKLKEVNKYTSLFNGIYPGRFRFSLNFVEPEASTKELDNIECVSLEDIKNKMIGVVHQKTNEDGNYEFEIKDGE